MNSFFRKIFKSNKTDNANKTIPQQTPTSSSFTQARMKIEPNLFSYLNFKFVKSYYKISRKQGDLKLFNGRRLIAADTSRINVPDTDQTRESFTLQTNKSKDRPRVQALGLLCCDVLNNITIASSLKKLSSEPMMLINELRENKSLFNKDDIILADRAYADFRLLSYLSSRKIDYLIRFPRSTYREVMDFIESDQIDKVIEIDINTKTNPQMKQYIKDNRLPEKIKLRVVKIELETPRGKEIEILGTSLLDSKQWATEDFKGLYFMRWGVETYIDRFKNIYEVENFTGKSVQSIKQDYYGMVLLTNYETLLTETVEEEIEERNSRGNKYQQQVNHSVSASVLVDNMVEIFYSHKDTDEILEELKDELLVSPVLKRPNRKYPRRGSNTNIELYYQKYVKKHNP